jgi:peptidyl-prolyl cis-trans isomerase B (cyclophilin B)
MSRCARGPGLCLVLLVTATCATPPVASVPLGSSDAGTSSDAAVDIAAAPTDQAIAAIQAQIDAWAVDKSPKKWRTKLPKPVPVAFTPGRSYYWLLETDKGPMKLKFRPDVAPMHVTSTIYLTLMGFYDTLKFHRIIKGFMAQGGDPLGTGTGGPGYAYGLEASSAAKHDSRGVLSMANAGTMTDDGKAIETEGSQFFITFAAQPGLDGGYSVFGKLVAGDATLAAIEAGGTADDGVPVKVTILSATVAVE